MKGKIVSWKGDKGFGFISTEDKSEKIFFHISSVKKADRKPALGDTVIFEVTRDSQGRLKATHVLLEGISLATPEAPKKIVTKPAKKDALDYIIYFSIFLLFAVSFSLFVKTGEPEPALIPGIILIAALYFLLKRKKQPENKLFSCSKCHAISNHDERTILAWNQGFNRLYCRACHKAWLREQPREQSRRPYFSAGSGCLGLFLVIASFPILCIAGVISWLA